MKWLLFLSFLSLSHFQIRPAILICIILAYCVGHFIWRDRKRVVASAEKAKVDKEKQEYLSYLNREIRSSMTLISSPLKELTGKSYDEHTDKVLKSMRQNADKVIFLLNKALNVEKISEDHSGMKFWEVDLVRYVRSMLSVFYRQASTGNIDMSFHSDNDTLLVWINRYSFDELFLNLTDYIISSTPANGKIEIEVLSDDKFAEILIKDTGTIIDEDRLPHLFELFQRSDSGDITGANMEFYSFYEIIRQHKGSINVSNRPGNEGRCFSIKIPLGRSHIPENSIVNKSSIIDEVLSSGLYSDGTVDSADSGNGAASTRKYSVIAIDGNQDIRRYIRTLLSPRFNVATFADATEGYNAVITESPDLVIAEFMVSDIDGMSIVKKLKGNSNTAHIPVILETASPGDGARLKGLLTGADAVFTKPFNEEEFILVCTNLIMSRSRLASHIKDEQITKELLKPVEMDSNDDVLMKKVLEIINKRISDPELNVETLADAIGMSRGHLHRKIKEITGTSPGDYIRAIRLNQAAQLLQGGKKNISQVAYSVGYSNPSVFSTAFKAFFGIPAKEYQKRNSGSDEPAGQSQPESVD